MSPAGELMSSRFEHQRAVEVALGSKIGACEITALRSFTHLHTFPSSLSFLFALLLWSALPARAQVPDTTRTDTLAVRTDTLRLPPDVLAAPADTLRLDTLRAERPTGPPVGFASPAPGRLVSRELPVLQPATDGTGLLAAVPGSFVYNFGAYGWPDGWSPQGLPPHRVALQLGKHPFNDLVTGRPYLELLPLTFIQPLRTGMDRIGRPAAVYAELRPYDVTRPLTELRYRAGGTGMQSIAALHTQQRRLALQGRPGVLGIVGGYFGRAADNEYPGSDLRRGRRLLLRLRYAQRPWSVELVELHTRRSIGAQGGVIPPGIFTDRGTADVRHPDARRRLIRNDFTLTARARLFAGAPFTASAVWTTQYFRYSRDTTALAADVRRYGLRLRQPAVLGRHHLLLRLDASLARVKDGNALPHVSRTRLAAGLRGTFDLSGADLVLEGVLHTGNRQTYASGLARATSSLGPLRLFAGGALAGQSVSFAAAHGLDSLLLPVDSLSPGAVMRGHAGLALDVGVFDFELSAFAHRITRPLDFYARGPAGGTAAAVVAPGAFRRAGLTLALGARREARRGLYTTAQATYTRFLNASASPLHTRAARALPNLSAEARLGARFALFTEDLIIDAYVRGRFWSDLRSRTLHAPTGLLVLPTLETGTTGPGVIGPSGTIGAVAEIRLPTATFFLVYENALSGTRLQPGTLLVPTYPLPAQRFRFGVYWPISG